MALETRYVYEVVGRVLWESGTHADFPLRVVGDNAEMVIEKYKLYEG